MHLGPYKRATDVTSLLHRSKVENREEYEMDFKAGDRVAKRFGCDLRVDAFWLRSSS